MRREYIIENDLVKITTDISCINIVLVEELTCVKWGNCWDDVRNVLFNSKSLTNVNVNFERCLYADPIPLMSLLLELVNLTKEYKKVVSIIIPSVLQNDVDGKNYKKAQFLKYLATQGFLRIMFDNFFVRNQKKILKEEVIEKYSGYGNNPLYSGEVIVPVQTYELVDEKQKQVILDSILDAFMFSFKNKVGLHTYNSMKGYIYNITNELIENAIKHAYDEHEKKKFALYIRNIRANNDSKTNIECINGFERSSIRG